MKTCMERSQVAVVTGDHIKLLRRAYVDWWDCETGAPAIDPKRPYGHSDVARHVGEILGWKWVSADGMPCALQQKALAIHHGTAVALQVWLRYGQPTTGTFVNCLCTAYDWMPVEVTSHGPLAGIICDDPDHDYNNRNGLPCKQGGRHEV